MRIKDYFAFTRGEKRGALILLIIISLLIVAQFAPDYLKENNQNDFSEFETAIDEFEKSKSQAIKNSERDLILFDFNPNTLSDSAWLKLGFKEWQIKAINNYKAKGGSWKVKSDVAKIYGLPPKQFEQLKPYILLPESIGKSKTQTSKHNKVIAYFNFNPNTITDKQWKELGFSEWQINNINKYKSKGGKWKIKNDVSKIYGLSDEDFLNLKPYINLPEEKIKPIKTLTKVNINTASAKEFTLLKGIYSEKYGAIIVKYRSSLGGFIKKEQLLEVWNMNQETYESFSPQVVLSDTTPTQININIATTDKLKEHPYIDWKTANAIIKYRKANGNYTSIKEIKKLHLISEKLYSKIAPYLNTK